MHQGDRGVDEHHRKTVETRLGGVICERCGATLATYYSRCLTPLEADCPGFRTIEGVIAEVKGAAGPRH